MKIEKSAQKVNFVQLDYGDVFISDGCTYLKVLFSEEREDIAVNLEDNLITYFDTYEKVTFVPQAKLVM